MSQFETIPPDGVGDLTRPSNPLYQQLVDDYEAHLRVKITEAALR